MQASHVPYRGSLPALNDVVAGHIPMMFVDLGPATGALRSRHGAPARHLDHVRGIRRFPTFRRSTKPGVPGFEAVSAGRCWSRRRKTPRPIVDQLNRELTAILAHAGHQGADRSSSDSCRSHNRSRSRSCKDFVKSETARWGKVVRDAGIAGSQ